MRLKIEGVKIDKLHDDNQVEYTIIGDASLHVKEHKLAWCCMTLNRDGAGNILYGTQNGVSDIQTSELIPYSTALHYLLVQLGADTDYDLGRYKPRVHIVTDSANIEMQFTTNSSSTHTEGLWRQIGLYKNNYFDLAVSHKTRRSHPTLSFCDTAAKALAEEHGSLEGVINDILKRFNKPLRGL